MIKHKGENNIKCFDPVKEHAGHQWLLVRGNWGPHRAKYICADCDGKWVKWHSIKASVNKYNYGINRQTEDRSIRYSKNT